MTLSADRKKHLRALGHPLKPVVTVASKGLSDPVLAEIERALEDHELIKVSVRADDRSLRRALTEAICDRTGAELVQAIGKVILIHRAAREPNPKLSNLLRNTRKS